MYTLWRDNYIHRKTTTRTSHKCGLWKENYICLDLKAEKGTYLHNLPTNADGYS